MVGGIRSGVRNGGPSRGFAMPTCDDLAENRALEAQTFRFQPLSKRRSHPGEVVLHNGAGIETRTRIHSLEGCIRPFLPALTWRVPKMGMNVPKLVHHTGLEPVKHGLKGRSLDALHYGVLKNQLAAVTLSVTCRASYACPRLIAQHYQAYQWLVLAVWLNAGHFMLNVKAAMDGGALAGRSDRLTAPCGAANLLAKIFPLSVARLA